MTWIREYPTGVVVSVRVTPNAKHDMIQDVREDVVCVRLRAPPVEGKANRNLIKFFADVFQTNRSKVTIVKGATSRTKAVSIAGFTELEARTAIEEWGLA